MKTRNVCIWGAEFPGKFVIQQLLVYLPEWNIVSVVDDNPSLHGKTVSNRLISAPEQGLKDLDKIDLLVICCNDNFTEIATIAVSQYGFPKNKILYVDTRAQRPILIGHALDSALSDVKDYIFKYRPFDPNAELFNEIILDFKSRDSILDAWGIEYRTDKASVLVYDRRGWFRFAHDYLRHYETFFQSYRHENIRICELGCDKGSSLRLWKKYFDQASVVGVDINPDAKNLEEERIEIVIGNAAHQETADILKRRYGKFSIIIDDASHAWGDMRTSFEMLWDLLPDGGIYILEDINCGSQGAFPQYQPQIYDSQPILDYVLNRAKILEVCKEANPEYNAYQFNFRPERIRKIESELDSITIIHGACIVKKGRGGGR